MNGRLKRAISVAQEDIYSGWMCCSSYSKVYNSVLVKVSLCSHFRGYSLVTPARMKIAVPIPYQNMESAADYYDVRNPVLIVVTGQYRGR